MAPDVRPLPAPSKGTLQSPLLSVTLPSPRAPPSCHPHRGARPQGQPRTFHVTPSSKPFLTEGGEHGSWTGTWSQGGGSREGAVTQLPPCDGLPGVSPGKSVLKPWPPMLCPPAGSPAHFMLKLSWHVCGSSPPSASSWHRPLASLQPWSPSSPVGWACAILSHRPAAPVGSLDTPGYMSPPSAVEPPGVGVGVTGLGLPWHSLVSAPQSTFSPLLLLPL